MGKKRFYPSAAKKKEPLEPPLEPKKEKKKFDWKESEQWKSNRAGSWKSTICLRCRKPGHAARFCPQKDDKTVSKVCYKCGEGGHSVWDCPKAGAAAGGKFAFASCYVCGEKGHISKECPKNTHGIYVNGGCCKICQGVDHLAKDCPKKLSEPDRREPRKGKESAGKIDSESKSKSLKLGGDDLEDDFKEEGEEEEEEEQEEEEVEPPPKKKQKGPKVVKF